MQSVVVISFAVMGMIVAAIVGGLLSAIPVWLLWNAVIPSIFGLPSIGFWQALGLSLLCAFLFKSSSSDSSSK